MSTRKRQVRRDSVLDVILEALGHQDLGSRTLQQIAQSSGVSRWSLLRSFGGREDLELAVLDRIRIELGAVAEKLLAVERPAHGRLRELTTLMLDLLESRPAVALSSLLFAASTDPRTVAALRQIQSMQVELVLALVEEAERSEGWRMRPGLMKEAAARTLVELTCGAFFAWFVADRSQRLERSAQHIWDVWAHGVFEVMPRREIVACASLDVENGNGSQAEGDTASAKSDHEAAALRANSAHEANPAQEANSVHEENSAHGAETARDTTSAHETDSALSMLDVRPILASGVDPLRTILARLASIPNGGVLEVIAPFRPVPLIALLTSHGHRVEERLASHGVHVVDVIVKGSPLIEDLSTLPAPEPLEHVLAATSGLAEHGVYLARVPKRPALLLPMLQDRGLTVELIESMDGSVLLRVERPR